MPRVLSPMSEMAELIRLGPVTSTKKGLVAVVESMTQEKKASVS